MTTLKLFDIEHAWGLPRKVSPRFGARLILRGLHLDYLNDRASFVGEFPPAIKQQFIEPFPPWLNSLNGWWPPARLMPLSSTASPLSTLALPVRQTP